MVCTALQAVVLHMFRDRDHIPYLEVFEQSGFADFGGRRFHKHERSTS